MWAIHHAYVVLSAAPAASQWQAGTICATYFHLFLAPCPIISAARGQRPSCQYEDDDDLAWVAHPLFPLTPGNTQLPRAAPQRGGWLMLLRAHKKIAAAPAAVTKGMSNKSPAFSRPRKSSIIHARGTNPPQCISMVRKYVVVCSSAY